MPIEHSDIGLAEIHLVHNWEYADAAARTGASGFIASDVGKWAKQLDDGTFWELTATTPTWVQVAGPTLPPAAHASTHENGGSDEIDVTGLSGVLADAQVADKAIESGGPTTLDFGAIVDGEFLKRVGTEIVSDSVPGGAEAGANSDITSMDGLTGAIESPTRVTVAEVAAPSTPSAGFVHIYAKADGKLYIKDDAGTETDLTAAGGGSIAPLVIEGANEVAQRNGANSQSFFVYGTFTSSTNYERANVGILSGTVVGIASEKGSGGGSVRDVALKRDTVSVTLSNGSFLPSTSNATDLGGGSNKWKDAYVVRGLFDTINLSTGGNKAILSDPSGRLFGGTLRVQDGAGNPGTFAGTDSTRSAFGSNQNDYSMEGQISYMQRWSSDASRDVTGISVSQVSGQMHLIVNIGSNDIVLKHESASSSAANRFLCSTGADITLGANQAADLNYDSASQRWRVFKRN